MMDSMKELLDFAEKSLKEKDLIRLYGQTDVLLLYAIVGEKLKKFLKDRELASKIWLPSGNIPYLIKRGSKLEPLSIEELTEAVTLDFLETRSEKESLSSVKGDITDLQDKVWRYFLPRKLADFFYATNREGSGKPIDRIFFDLDRGKNVSATRALEVTRLFVNAIEEDDELEGLLGCSEPFVCWTGNSFHVYLFMDEEKPNSFYEEYFQYSKKDPKASFTGRWVEEVNKQTDFKIVGGHEKRKDSVNIDPSQTPSGKLCRVPLGSLHMKDAKTVDGVSIPLTREMIERNDLAEELQEYEVSKVVENLDELSKRLPERFR